jgi:hypothetical protein
LQPVWLDTGMIASPSIEVSDNIKPVRIRGLWLRR